MALKSKPRFNVSIFIGDDPESCMYCGSNLVTCWNYVPANDVRRSNELHRVAVSCCHNCRNKIYPLRHLYITIESQLEKFGRNKVKMLEKEPGHETSSESCKITPYEASIGYTHHPEAKYQTCMYCEAFSGDKRDRIPDLHRAEFQHTNPYEIQDAKYIVPCCGMCKSRLINRNKAFNTLESRFIQVAKVGGVVNERLETKIGKALTKPWQRAMYDDAGVRHVLDIDDILLTDHEREAKNAWTIEQSKLTT